MSTEETVVTEEKKVLTDEERYGRLTELDPELTIPVILSYKKKYDRVLATTMNGKVYLYRPISRIEYTGLMTGLKIGESATPFQQNQVVSEKIVEKCLLHPMNIVSEGFTNTKGGTVEALREAIMFCSDFFSVDQVLAMTEEL